MSHETKMKNLSWFTIVLLSVAGSGFAFLPTAGEEEPAALEDLPVVLENLDSEVLPLPDAGEGNGAYCKIKGLGAYFYGKDLSDEITSYPEFETWCEGYGGTVGWSE
jgi:hypothetical protein